MRKTAQIDLVGEPWPANLLKCCRHTGKMAPGDEMVISVKDADVKDNLVMILKAMPEFRFVVAELGHGFDINVKKIRPRAGAKEREFTGED